ncbi:MAG: hypothetical protein A3H27_10165 [Acidobacteria bacterium RIFCSPLOWO2_02_FULL_59_13]|nr:MAG: hypothetical protein A3H27_10165 [Acidobacteria bacterium RIFCSPLOWO2_02_FULL_59_13]
MAADNKLEPVIQVDAAKGNAAIQSVNKNLTRGGLHHLEKCSINEVICMWTSPLHEARANTGPSMEDVYLLMTALIMYSTIS